MIEKINCQDITFLIPVKIESNDRLNNAKFTLNFLYENLDTNIIIYEAGSSKVPSIFDINRENILYIQQDLKDGEPFHRTKYLNKMLKLVHTTIVSNYDVDVILELDVYKNIYQIFKQYSFDLIFPYGNGEFQKQVHQNFHNLKIDNYNNVDEIFKHLNSNYNIYSSQYGHCQFFKTSSYIEGGMENEDFISYAPEDKERHYRFVKLGYKVGRLDSNFIYHLEHQRGLDSGYSNPFFSKNIDLWNKIQKMSVFELSNYYKN